MMKLLAINGSPRKSMNTASILEKIVAGALSKKSEAELIHLRDLNFKGCISCFHCKDPKGRSYGRCVIKDDLAPVLQAAHEADVLVLGSPFYFSMETALMRACMERLWFQYHRYTNKKPPLSPRKKATALVYTMNVREEEMEAYGKNTIIARSKGLMEHFFAPCSVFLCCDTKQVNDYSKYEFDVFDVPGKLKRHDEVFPKELEQAFAFGAGLVTAC
jgi:multimeric flavodoxin WrbA